MVETEITILINRKSDFDTIKQIVIEQKIQSPVFMFEYENHFQLNLTSDYEQWELDSAILAHFPEYEFASEKERGRKEIRLQVKRVQPEYSVYTESPLNQTRYLVKKSASTKSEWFNPEVKVLFEHHEQSYFINIVDGINKTSGQKGFLLLNEFKVEGKHGDNHDVLKDTLYKTTGEAFQFGYYKMQKAVSLDFADYIENKKKAIRDQQKVPRKIIRDFINACNKLQIGEIIKNLDDNLVFGKIGDWKGQYRVESLEKFKSYILSKEQEICSNDFKINNWYFNSTKITITVKYYSRASHPDAEEKSRSKYKQIKFELKGNKIKSIMLDV